MCHGIIGGISISRQDANITCIKSGMQNMGHTAGTCARRAQATHALRWGEVRREDYLTALNAGTCTRSRYAVSYSAAYWLKVSWLDLPERGRSTDA